LAAVGQGLHLRQQPAVGGMHYFPAQETTTFHAQNNVEIYSKGNASLKNTKWLDFLIISVYTCVPLMLFSAVK
jgi:hypothetical protein